MHAKYEFSTSYGSKVKGQDKDFPQTDRYTSQKLDASECHTGA